MGIYLNPGNEGFQESVRSKIYVDKTGLIAYTNALVSTKQKYICVSRPRRFGKSMALEMLAAYYSRGCDSRDLFAGFRIEREASFQEHLNKYHVICLNMLQFLLEAKNQQTTEYLEQEVLDELFEVYGEFLGRQNLGLAAALRRIYAKTKQKFIFLIDEWDCVMREKKEAEEEQKNCLDFLRSHRVHMEVASILAYNDENSLSCAIGLAYYSARKDYKMVREFPTGRGFADVIFLPLLHSGKPAIVLELKYNQSARAAIQQIKDRHYTQALEGYVGEILLVGINYNKEKADKNHSCVIEKLIKPECE